MAEPQPPTVTERASTDPHSTDPAPTPAGAEARKAAAALSSLSSHTVGGSSGADDEPATSSTTSAKNLADQKALGEAMSRLEIIDKGRKIGGESSKGKGVEGAGKGGQAEVKKKVKIDAADVTLLVEELEVVRTRLLRC